MDAEQEGNSSWTCADALFEMFLSDRADYSSDGISRDVIRSLIAGKLSGTAVENPRLCRQDKILIDDRLKILLEVEPRLELKKEMSRISWYRFGFRTQLNGVALSNNFIRSFGRWRLKLSLTGNSYTACDSGANMRKSNRVSSVGDVKFQGYTMDRFFHSAESIILFDDKVCWQLVRVNVKSITNDVTGSKLESPRRSLRDIVGARSYLAIRECIAIAARSDKFPAIENKEVAGRYQAAVTRDELVELLADRFPKRLKCAKSVIKRALSEFVICRGTRQRTFD